MVKKRRTGKRPAESGGAMVQIRSRESHPFGMLDNYVPLSRGEVRLYRAIREAVPVVDAAIIKLIRLTGGFKVECGSKKTERELGEFLQRVNCGRGQRGIHAFLDAYLDSLITCGRAVGEIVLTGRRDDIAALLCGNVADIEIREGETPIDVEICSAYEGAHPEPLPYQELLMFTPFNAEADSPYGVSLLRSMPFMTEILLKIYNSLGINWDRAGNLRFAVVYRPQGDSIDKTYARERAEQIAREWSSAMQSSKNGSIKDFVAVGDVDIKVIGADNQVLDSEVPVRQILEQLVARTGIPPFMLGLSWSTTERMSSEQANVISAEITAIRRTLTPVIEKICLMWLSLHGRDRKVEVVWDDISLRDAQEQAHAETYLAQAEYYRSQAARNTAQTNAEQTDNEGSAENEDQQGSDDGGEQEHIG